jgi:hypothetical protein
MKNISTQYQDLLEGKMTQAQFLRNARMMFPSFVTNHNSFDDSVKILKNKGMLVEGDAVKGAPDKEPTYDYPTQPGKYKKVVQEPEVDEQDGIYPATTLTDIPKEEVSKPIKSKTRPDGLEDIKNNDTKNEMKKVKVVKENYSKVLDLQNGDYFAIDDGWEDKYQGKNGLFFTIKGNNILDKDGKSIQSSPREFLSQFKPEEILKVKVVKENEKSFDEIFADFIENDDPKELIAYIKAKGKEAVAKLKAKLAENKLKKTQMNEANKIAADAQAVITLLSKQPMILQKLSLINNKEELQPVFDFLLTKINPGFSKGTAQIRTATNQTLTAREKTKPMAERLKPAITKLVQEVLDEMGPQ